MKTLLRLGALLLFAATARGQYVTVTNLSGTVAYGGVNVTVVPGGSATSTPWCGVSPYWIGPAGPGSYTFNFSTPVKAVRVFVTAMDVGFGGTDTEKVSIFINGVFYPLTSANITTYAGTCAQPTEPAIGGQMVCTIDLGSGGGGQIDVVECGIYSCEVWTNGVLNGNCQTFQFDTAGSCFRAVANSPCVGDTLFVDAVGDSTAATYSWSGPGLVSSTTTQSFFIYPATLADTGIYTVLRTVGGAVDTSRVHVVVNPLPVISVGNNSPLCAGMLDTLHLTESVLTAGETFHWSGPAGFTSTLQNPSINGFTPSDTGTYKVVAITAAGCKDSSTTSVSLVPPPPGVTITGQNQYCQGQPFIPFVVTGVSPGATVLWYPSGTGGVGSTTPFVINTAIPGTYTVWASQTIGSCESPRNPFTVQVKHTPPAPAVTGITQYCQFIGPFDTLNVTHPLGTDTTRWYTAAAGGSPIGAEPIPNIAVVPGGGSYQYWVSLRDSGCEGPRTPVSITIHPKPAPPTPTPPFSYCQFASPVGATTATVSAAGDVLQWYGAAGLLGSAPIPNTSAAPDTLTYYVTEASPFGCVSDSTADKIVIRLKPQPPVVTDSRYCQRAKPASLTTQVDSSYNSHLNWFYRTVAVPPVPVPVTDTLPMTYTWWVSQTVPSVNGCNSDSVALNVEVVYIPVFSIHASSPWVCRYDSIQLSYVPAGRSLFEPLYAWTLPQGGIVVNNTNLADSSITVAFDTANQYDHLYVVHLRTSDNSGFCFSDTSLSIKVIPLPTMTAYTNPEVCMNDTVQLSLSTRSDNAYAFSWYIDNNTLQTSPDLNIVSGSSNSSGPYSIAWTDTGKHVIKVTSVTQEGCKSLAAYDSVNVHNVPNPSFGVAPGTPGSLCIEDSVEFMAAAMNYNYKYEWTPAVYFNNENKPVIWGRMMDQKSQVTLRVTDPYGCYATSTLEIDPGTCCTLLFPNAFTPDGGSNVANNVFRPIYNGYHMFHVFRILNRWGQTVFESANSSDAQWDGRFNGVPQDIGTYYYFIKYDCGGQTFEQKGDVTLVR